MQIWNQVRLRLQLDRDQRGKTNKTKIPQFPKLISKHLIQVLWKISRNAEEEIPVTNLQAGHRISVVSLKLFKTPYTGIPARYSAILELSFTL